jgi:long-chain fatty acid transport protein
MHAFLKVLFLGLTLAASGYSSAGAGGLYLNEFATPSMGVAGAGREAVASDASTNSSFANPAGMTRLQGNSVSLGAGLLVGQSKFDADAGTPFSGGNGGNQAGLAPLIGSHGVYSITDDLKIGMSVFSLSGAALDPDDSWTGRYQNNEINLLTLTANPSLAYRVNDRLSFGAGVTVMYADLEYKLAAPPINPPAGGSGKVKIDGTDFAFGYNFGALFELSPQTRIGVTYVSKVEPKFSGDLKIEPGIGGSFSASSDLEFTFPLFVWMGAYN